MAKPFKCSNCGGSSKQFLSATEYKCVYCNTVFYEDKKEEVKPISEKEKKVNENAFDKVFFDDKSNVSTKIGVLVVVVLLLGVGSYSFYSVYSSAEDSQEEIDRAIEEKQDETDRYLKDIYPTVDEIIGLGQEPEEAVDSLKAPDNE